MPNWNRFQKIVKKMIETDLGGETCTITVPTKIKYDFKNGEVPQSVTTTTIKCALIKTTKDDLIDLPDGLREKIQKKIFTANPVIKTNKIVSDFDNIEYRVIIPSAAYQAGGLVHAYVTYLGKVETNDE